MKRKTNNIAIWTKSDQHAGYAISTLTSSCVLNSICNTILLNRAKSKLRAGLVLPFGYFKLAVNCNAKFT